MENTKQLERSKRISDICARRNESVLRTMLIIDTAVEEGVHIDEVLEALQRSAVGGGNWWESCIYK